LERRKRIVLCSLGVPDEREGAGRVIVFNFIESIRRANFDVLHIVLLEAGNESNTAFEKYRRLVAADGFEVVAATQPKFVVQGAISHRIDRTGSATTLERANAFDPDLIIAFDIIPAWFATAIAAPRKLTWLGDLNFQTTYYHGLYGLQERPWKALLFAKYCIAAYNWRRVYTNVLRGFDEVIVSAASSVEQLAGLGLRNHSYQPYPWPAMEKTVAALDKSSKPTFMFFGNLVGLGSRSALHFMIDQIYKRATALWGKDGFCIPIAGRGALPGWFSALIVDKPEFVQLGFVEDLPAVLAKCHAVLVPIDVPVGNRTRVLYALSQGVLVIAHKNVALGNPALIDGETCALAGDGAEFLARMQRSVEDQAWAQNTAENGRQLYETLFHPSAAGTNFLSRVNQHMNQASATD
jgi:hypothetical protein